ncbi:unnamed protein product [Victoria cruziana]
MGVTPISAVGTGALVPAPRWEMLLAKPGGGTGRSIAKIGRGDEGRCACSPLLPSPGFLSFVGRSSGLHLFSCLRQIVASS